MCWMTIKLKVTALTIALCLHLSLSSIAHAQFLAQPQDIQWSVERPLSWDDFLGVADADAPTENVALTATSLRWSYEYEIERDYWSCFYQITDLHAQAIFNQGDSWVKPSHRTAVVLNHEQRHFDLTQIYKLIFDERAHHLIDVRNICEGDTIEKAVEFTEGRAVVQAETLFEDVWQSYTAAQETYDDQTHHGVLMETQSLWTERIHRALRLEQWDEFIDERH